MIGCNKTGARTVCANVLYFLEGLSIYVINNRHEDNLPCILNSCKNSVVEWYVIWMMLEKEWMLVDAVKNCSWTTVVVVMCSLRAC